MAIPSSTRSLEGPGRSCAFPSVFTGGTSHVVAPFARVRKPPAEGGHREEHKKGMIDRLKTPMVGGAKLNRSINPC